MLGSAKLRDDRRIDDAIRAHDGPAGRWRPRRRAARTGRRARARARGPQLLLVEVVAQAVQDEGRDEDEGQGEDRHERERHAALEGVGHDHGRPCRSGGRRRCAGFGVGWRRGWAVDHGPARLALGERVPDATDRLDERGPGGVVLDLVAQVADVDVDRLLVLVERLVVAEELQELGSGVDAAGPAGEVAQDLELGRRSG